MLFMQVILSADGTVYFGYTSMAADAWTLPQYTLGIRATNPVTAGVVTSYVQPAYNPTGGVSLGQALRFVPVASGSCATASYMLTANTADLVIASLPIPVPIQLSAGKRMTAQQNSTSQQSKTAP